MVDQLVVVRLGGDPRGARRWARKASLGGQAQVQGVAGAWKDLTDNVNSMAAQPDRPGARTSPT
ncbi:hypothetical protein ACRAWD_28820 [Caulobacter segnis]